MVKYREIEPSDDARVAEIARYNLKKFHLDLPGTVYFDPELDHLSAFTARSPISAGTLSHLIRTDRLLAVRGLRNLKVWTIVQNSKSSIWWIPSKGKATEKIWYSSLRRAQKRQGTRACIWKHIQTFP